MGAGRPKGSRNKKTDGTLYPIQVHFRMNPALWVRFQHVRGNHPNLMKLWGFSEVKAYEVIIERALQAYEKELGFPHEPTVEVMAHHLRKKVHIELDGPVGKYMIGKTLETTPAKVEDWDK